MDDTQFHANVIPSEIIARSSQDLQNQYMNGNHMNDIIRVDLHQSRGSER